METSIPDSIIFVLVFVNSSRFFFAIKQYSEVVSDISDIVGIAAQSGRDSEYLNSGMIDKCGRLWQSVIKFKEPRICRRLTDEEKPDSRYAMTKGGQKGGVILGHFYERKTDERR